jgi:hypothetical protein
VLFGLFVVICSDAGARRSTAALYLTIQACNPRECRAWATTTAPGFCPAGAALFPPARHCSNVGTSKSQRPICVPGSWRAVSGGRNRVSNLTALTVVNLVHLVGLVMGFGGAILADFTIFSRGVIRPISEYTVFQSVLLSHVVTIGLIVLWCSGFGLIVVNSATNPDYLTNQKLWAKITRSSS